MINQNKVTTALTAKAAEIQAAQAIVTQDLLAYEQALNGLGNLNAQQLLERLAGIAMPGARPTPEWNLAPDLVVPFRRQFNNLQEARNWACSILSGRRVIAVDGSQIPPSTDISIPIAVVQIGWYENLHLPGGSYTKDQRVVVLAGEELYGETLDGAGDSESKREFPDEVVNRVRFQMEIEQLRSYMVTRNVTEPWPLCFFDGSMILSFTQHMEPVHQTQYIGHVRNLLDTSKIQRSPVVGYVASSGATDIVTMIAHLAGLSRGRTISDASLLRTRMNWGDRTPVFICARKDGVIEKYYEEVCFVYLKTTRDGSPARVEFPRWVYDNGLHEELLNLVRAEIAVGGGYPYPAETADAVAVITMEDREQFLGIFQQFAQRNGLALRFSQKAISKRRRRPVTRLG